MAIFHCVLICAAVCTAAARGDSRGYLQQPVHPLRLAALDDWPPPQDGLYHGDVRAVLQLTVAAAETATPAAPVTAQIFWRRRDANPEKKAVFITDSRGRAVAHAAPPQVGAACGVVSFLPNGDTTYYVYYLPYHQRGGGAGLHFSWANCTAHDRSCVLLQGVTDAGSGAAQVAPSCALNTATTTTVVALESRAVGKGSGRADFHALTPMELTATPEEVSALLETTPAAVGDAAASLRLFAEPRERAVRMFDRVPADWAREGEKVSLQLDARVGEYLTFQLGVFAPTHNLSNFGIEFKDLLAARDSATATATTTIATATATATARAGDRESVPASAFTCFNLGGVDYHGQPFNSTEHYAVAAGAVGSLWIGLALPTDARAAGVFATNLTLSADASGGSGGGGGRATVQVSIVINVTLPADGKPLFERGDGDIYGMSRLRWLDSTRGIDDTVPAPFTAPAVVPSTAVASEPESHGLTRAAPRPGNFSVDLVNKRISIGADGLLAQVAVHPNVAAFGASNAADGDYVLLARPMAVQLLSSAGCVPVDLAVTAAARVVGSNNTGVYWEAALGGGGVSVRVAGSVEYDSFLSYTIELSSSGSAGKPVELADVQLSLEMDAAHARYMVGFGVEGVPAQPLTWNWQMGTGNNGLWLGRPEAGIFLKLRGDGPRWEDPMYSSDFGTIPFIPPSWGGADATPSSTASEFGANVTAGDGSMTVLAFSGPRTLGANAEVFRFDVAATPSKPLNLSAHFAQKYLQVGYGTSYISPQDAAARNASVVTLHQGIPGMINGTLVNPYINYPFVPVTVELMENYTSQARALGMRTKFYYTIRELSNHAAELFALKAIGQGEMLVSGDPYFVPQPGYCHDWDCHGASWLHQHVVTDYNFCWQQALADGEWDAAVCDIGTSRWFNYYVNGLFWSTANAPHIDGIYYDGINFDRKSMQRVRKTLDAGAAARGDAGPLVDIHTGDNGPGSPSATRYLSHFAYADSAWNGEGFKWTNGPAYYLIDVSAFIHGVAADVLGGGGFVFRALLFGMYVRNSAESTAIWGLWSDVGIGDDDMAMYGFWADHSPAKLTLANASAPTPPPTPCVQSFALTKGAYRDTAHGPDGNIGFGGGCGEGRTATYPAMTAAEAQALCCELASANGTCAGFTIAEAKDAQGRSTGCLKKDLGGPIMHNGAFDGYALPSAPPVQQCSVFASSDHDKDGANSAVLATVHMAPGRLAVVIIATWCTTDARVTLALDWAALGLQESTSVVTTPAIAGVQYAAPSFPAAKLGAMPIDVQVGKGIVLVVRPGDEIS